jgi:hypothetical protein
MSRPLSAFLFLVASVAQSAVVFSPERPVSEPVYDAGVGFEAASAAASDGNDFLVIWSNGPLYASHVSTSREVRVPAVLIRSGGASNASACWTGSAYLVTWSDATEQSVMLASLSRDGSLLTPPHVILPQARTFAGGLASNGRNVLVVYATGYPSDARGAILDSTGAVIRPNVPLPASSATVDDSIKVASDGTNFVVIWKTSMTHALVHTLPTPPPPTTTTNTYLIARVDAFGQLVDPAGAVIGTVGASSGFGVSYGSGRYAVATLERQFGTAATLRRFVIDAATLQAEALPSIDAGGFEASVTWNGFDFVAYWMDYDYNRFALMSVIGTRQPVALFSGNYLGIYPILVTNGSKFLATWTDRSRMPAGSTYGGDLFGAFLDQSGSAPSARFLIGYSPRPQSQPVIATSGADSLVVWREQTNDSGIGKLLGTRVRADGTVLDTPPINLDSDLPVSGDKPAVGFTGAAYFVAWQSASGTIRGRRVEQNGQLGSAIDFGGGSGPAVTSNGSITLLAFSRYPKIVATRIDGNDRILDDPPLVVDRAGRNASVASNGTDFLVVWTEGSDYFPGPPPIGQPNNLLDVFGARVSHSGAVDAAPIAIATGPKDQGSGVVVSDGRDYLVLYYVPGTNYDNQLAAKRVLAEGVLAGTTPEDDGVIVAANVRDFSVARDAGGFAVVWQTSSGYTESALEFTQTDDSGEPRETVAIVHFDPRFVRPSPSVASNGSISVVAYVRLAEQYDWAQRLFFRFAGAPRARAMRPGK